MRMVRIAKEEEEESGTITAKTGDMQEEEETFTTTTTQVTFMLPTTGTTATPLELIGRITIPQPSTAMPFNIVTIIIIRLFIAILIIADPLLTATDNSTNNAFLKADQRMTAETTTAKNKMHHMM